MRIWRISDDEKLTPTSLCALDAFNSKIEHMLFHPSADSILAVASGRQLSFCDLTSAKSVLTNELAGDVLQSISWNSLGNQLASIGKDRTVRMHDPRTDSSTCSEIQKFNSGKEFQVNNNLLSIYASNHTYGMTITINMVKYICRPTFLSPNLDTGCINLL